MTKGDISLSYEQLLEEVTRRRGDLELALTASESEYLPLLVDTSLDSYLTVLTCLVHHIPFGMIDGLAPQARIADVMQLFGNPQAGWWGSLVSGNAVPREWLRQGLTRAKNSELRSTTGSFVITTSGSTGTPKGVVIPVAHLMARVEDMVAQESSVENPRLSSFSPLHFIGGLSRLARIFLGHHLQLFDAMSHSGGQILTELANAQVTHLHLPPQLGRLLSNYSNPSGIFLDAVTDLRMGSEGMRFEVLQGLKKYLNPTVTFWHGLGATEGGGAIRGRYVLGETPPSGQIPLGDIQPGTRLVSLEGLESGYREVWLSRHIAREYLGQPDLTAQRFLTDEEGVRFWRSGDLVEVGSDHRIYHRGRLDDVVKVRGVLTSPSETTRILLGIHGVGAAVTLPHTSRGNTRLVSHVEARPNSQMPSVPEIRDILRRSLPANLLPAEIEIYDQLPTTPRGKIDRVLLQRKSSQTPESNTLTQ